MIKFFRNIRQKLISEGKISNYLKYAINEIMLVVIGSNSPGRDFKWVEQINVQNHNRAFRYGICDGPIGLKQHVAYLRHTIQIHKILFYPYYVYPGHNKLKYPFKASNHQYS